MTDINQIQQLLKTHFKIKGDVKIDPHTGIVDVSGDVEMKKKANKLPVSFGVVSADFRCWDNQLTSLEGAPSSVGGNFWCNHNQLTSLAGAPHSVGGDFRCHRNQLTSLEGAPSSVGGDFVCDRNQLTSLAGAPHSVGGNFYLDYSRELPLLRTLVAKKITCVNAPAIVNDILNRYADQGNKGVLRAAAELIKAGFRDNARL